MSTLTQDQALFVLRTSGLESYLSKVDIQQLFSRALSSPLGKLAAELATEYQLKYNPDNSIVLGNPPPEDNTRSWVVPRSVVAITNKLEERLDIPFPSNYFSEREETPAVAMKFLEEYGKYYNFNNDYKIFVSRAADFTFGFHFKNMQEWNRHVSRPFYNSIVSTLGKISADVAQTYQVSFDVNGNVRFGIMPTVEDLRSRFQGAGIWIPYPYRTSPEKLIEYIFKFGYKYYNFYNSTLPENERMIFPWHNPRYEGSKLHKYPAYKGNDAYLNRFLNVHLQQLFTDFDLFNHFPFIKNYLQSVNNRGDIINTIVYAYNPAGNFEIIISSEQGRPLTLIHRYGNTTEFYSEYNIKSLAQNGILQVGQTRLPHIGLYQIAFELKPVYLHSGEGWNYPDFIERKYKHIMENLYDYFIQQIQIAESRGEPKFRFSEHFATLNADLDNVGLPDISRLQI